MLELGEVGTNWQVTRRHDEPPLQMPDVRVYGQEVRVNLGFDFDQVDSVLPADGRRPARLASA